MSGLNDAHRLIAQLFLARNVISDAELKQLVAVGCQVTQQPGEHAGVAHTRWLRLTLRLSTFAAMEVGDCVHAINLSLRDLKMEIKSGVSELDGALYFALVGTASDPIAQLATPLEAWYAAMLAWLTTQCMTDKSAACTGSWSFSNNAFITLSKSAQCARRSGPGARSRSWQPVRMRNRAELGRADHVDLLNLRPEARSLEVRGRAASLAPSRFAHLH